MTLTLRHKYSCRAKARDCFLQLMKEYDMLKLVEVHCCRSCAAYEINWDFPKTVTIDHEFDTREDLQLFRPGRDNY